MNEATKILRAALVKIEGSGWLDNGGRSSKAIARKALEEFEGVKSKEEKIHKALMLIATDEGIGTYLNEHDPKAWEQVLSALDLQTGSEPIENSGLEFEGYFIKGPFWSDDEFGYFCSIQDKGGMVLTDTMVVASEAAAVDEAKYLIDNFV